jgi:hypothetical protein
MRDFSACQRRCGALRSARANGGTSVGDVWRGFKLASLSATGMR